MNKTITLLSTLVLLGAVSAPAATVTVLRGSVIFSESLPSGENIRIEFASCMANKLYTFKSVSVNGTPVNTTTSDNIGPFMLADGSWTGGNHLNNDVRSARTNAVRVYVDGQEVSRDKQASYKDCSVLDIEVDNILLIPGKEDKEFAEEKMSYRVAGNSIDVTAHHTYKNESPITVSRYYGMQSMMQGETEILTPGGAYSRWTPIAGVDRFNKASAPNFCTFIEHSPECYQAAYMATEGLGDRHLIDDNDWVFIGNSYSKSYHKTIGDKQVKAGDETMWHGVYTWFVEPVLDGCRDEAGSGEFEYAGYLGGKPVIFHLNSDGTMSTGSAGADKNEIATQPPFASAGRGTIAVDPACLSAVVYNLAGAAVHHGCGTFNCRPGVYIVSDGRGKSLKMLVR